MTLSDLRGKVVLGNFWTIGCPPCRAEMPAIENIYQSLKPLGLEVVAVNQTNLDSENEVARFVQELSLALLIPLDRRREVSTRNTLQGLPGSYFIDRKEVIRSVVDGCFKHGVRNKSLCVN